MCLDSVLLKCWSDLLLMKIHHTHNRKNEVNNSRIAQIQLNFSDKFKVCMQFKTADNQSHIFIIFVLIIFVLMFWGVEVRVLSSVQGIYSKQNSKATLWRPVLPRYFSQSQSMLNTPGYTWYKGHLMETGNPRDDSLCSQMELWSLFEVTSKHALVLCIAISEIAAA